MRARPRSQAFLISYPGRIKAISRWSSAANTTGGSKPRHFASRRRCQVLTVGVHALACVWSPSLGGRAESNPACWCGDAQRSQVKFAAYQGRYRRWRCADRRLMAGTPLACNESLACNELLLASSGGVNRLCQYCRLRCVWNAAISRRTSGCTPTGPFLHPIVR